MRLFKVILLVFPLYLSVAQTSSLNLEEIMKGEEFVGFQPENPVWGFDNETVYFDWNPKNEPGKSTYYWKKGMAEPKLATPEDEQFYRSRFITNDYQTYYYVSGGALYSYQPKTKIKKRLFQNTAPVMNLTLGKTPGVVFFEQSGNIYKLNTADGSLCR